MARSLTFLLNGQEYVSEPFGIDRSKLYGWTETLALDDNGNPCKLISMDESGAALIPPKGTAAAILSADKKWISKDEIKYVTPDGSPAVKIPSSYSAPVTLKEKATMEQFLNHSISSVYLLPDLPEDVVTALSKDIYTFKYNYYDSYKEQRAFLLEKEGAVYMLVGTEQVFQMLGLENPGAVEAEEEESSEAEDTMDFGF